MENGQFKVAVLSAQDAPCPSRTCVFINRPRESKNRSKCNRTNVSTQMPGIPKGQVPLYNSHGERPVQSGRVVWPRGTSGPGRTCVFINRPREYKNRSKCNRTNVSTQMPGIPKGQVLVYNSHGERPVQSRVVWPRGTSGPGRMCLCFFQKRIGVFVDF